MTETTAETTVEDWPGLVDWLAAHPLPEGKDMDVNLTELSTVFGVSTNTVKSWLTQTEGRMPYVAKGSNGREYVLRLSWCFAWRQNQEAQKQSRANDLAKLQGQLFGVESDNTDQGLTPKQVREVSEARIKHAEAQKLLGRLTEIEGVYGLFDRVFVMFRDSAMGMSDRLERELGLTPPQARQVDRAMDEMLTALTDGLKEEVIGRDYSPNLELNAQLVNHT